MPYITSRFPEFDSSLRALVQEHGNIDGEPLHLAVAYDAGRDSDHVFLFELIGNFGSNLVDPDRRLFETTFAGARVFPEGERRPDLHVVLTSPSELTVALQESWPAAVALQRAIAAGNYDILYQDAVGKEAWTQLTAYQAAP
jgi:hypothetical protein